MRLQDFLQGEAQQEEGPFHKMILGDPPMKVLIDVTLDIDEDLKKAIFEPLIVESRSAPAGGDLGIIDPGCGKDLIMEMRSEDLSTSRAMLNSYMGLLQAALEAAERG
jgi:tRNA threonylcarbamoyladenosine modification (KEOPS) complex  Pcc1 subunit